MKCFWGLMMKFQAFVPICFLCLLLWICFWHGWKVEGFSVIFLVDSPPHPLKHSFYPLWKIHFICLSSYSWFSCPSCWRTARLVLKWGVIGGSAVGLEEGGGGGCAGTAGLWRKWPGSPRLSIAFSQWDIYGPACISWHDVRESSVSSKPQKAMGRLKVKCGEVLRA